MESKKPFVITVVVFMLIILGLGGFIVYDKFLSKESKEASGTVINDVSVDVNGLLKVSTILDTLDNAYNNPDSTYYGYMQKIKSVDSKDYDTKAAIFAVVYNNMIRSNTEQTISSEVVKNQIQTIFGTSIKYTPVTVEAGDNIKITYNDGKYTYKASIPTGSTNKYYTRNVKTTLKADYVVITRKMFYAEIGNTSATIYTNADKTNKLGEVMLRGGEISTKEVISKYGSRLSTFDYTFKYDLGEFYLRRIERTN